MPGYLPTIGLEIHAELKTATKMFCGCRNEPEAAPNTRVCAVCLAHPGTLPVINAEAVKKVLMVGTALNASLADFSEFDRKNYFYPDIPKGYQISQYQHPLVAGGALGGVAITRVHLEEDTARSQHAGGSSLVDYNRAGVPLMELVTEPVIHDAATAGRFAKELQLLLRSLGAGEANMEKGEMRVEANISVSKDGTLGTKVEVKNLNSFRSVERAIAYEVARQTTLLEEGGTVVQETRGWDEQKGVTFSQRKKEGSADYRYFPDPDIPKLRLEDISMFKNLNVPETPAQMRERLNAMGILQAQDVEQLVGDAALARLFAAVESVLDDAVQKKIAANFILNDIAGHGQIPSPEFLAAVVRAYASGEIASPQAKASLREGRIIAAEGNIDELVLKVLAAHPAAVAEYRAGKAASLQFLIGQGMKESRGSANPETLRAELLKRL